MPEQLADTIDIFSIDSGHECGKKFGNLPTTFRNEVFVLYRFFPSINSIFIP